MTQHNMPGPLVMPAAPPAAPMPRPPSPPSPRTLALTVSELHQVMRASAHGDEHTQLRWPSNESRLPPGSDPFIKPLAPAPSRTLSQAGAKAGGARTCLQLPYVQPPMPDLGSGSGEAVAGPSGDEKAAELAAVLAAGVHGLRDNQRLASREAAELAAGLHGLQAAGDELRCECDALARRLRTFAEARDARL